MASNIGSKQQKRFKRLMLHRIKWSAYIVGEHGRKAKAEANANKSGTNAQLQFGLNGIRNAFS